MVCIFRSTFSLGVVINMENHRCLYAADRRGRQKKIPWKKVPEKSLRKKCLRRKVKRGPWILWEPFGINFTFYICIRYNWIPKFWALPVPVLDQTGLISDFKFLGEHFTFFALHITYSKSPKLCRALSAAVEWPMQAHFRFWKEPYAFILVLYFICIQKGTQSMQGPACVVWGTERRRAFSILNVCQIHITLFLCSTFIYLQQGN